MFSVAWMMTAVLLAGLVSAVPVAAAELPAPAGPVLLTVSGNIAHTTSPGRADFDRRSLEALGFERLRTTTPWTDGVVAFEGVPLCRLLDHLGAGGTVLQARALNDFVADIPREDCRRWPVLLALRQNGVELSRRDKGPIWIVYPRDDFPELDDPRINMRWVWQLRSLDVR